MTGMAASVSLRAIIQHRRRLATDAIGGRTLAAAVAFAKRRRRDHGCREATQETR
jgi:hypothetical protein